MKEYGIVLRLYPSHKFSVITNALGKIVLMAPRQNNVLRIRPSSLIEFTYKTSYQNVHVVKDIAILFTPLPQCATDLFWLHHLMELCYYFIPLHEASDEVFTMLKNCIALLTSYHLFELNGWEAIKRLCISSILLSIGFFPPDSLKKPILIMKKTLLLFIDFSNSSSLEFLQNELSSLRKITISNIDKWILECLKTHPQLYLFKTINFIYKPHLTVTWGQ